MPGSRRKNGTISACGGTFKVRLGLFRLGQCLQRLFYWVPFFLPDSGNLNDYIRMPNAFFLPDPELGLGSFQLIRHRHSRRRLYLVIAGREAGSRTAGRQGAAGGQARVSFSPFLHFSFPISRFPVPGFYQYPSTWHHQFLHHRCACAICAACTGVVSPYRTTCSSALIIIMLRANLE